MAMDLRLVSAGDDIRIWDCNDFILTKQLSPHDQNVSSVCWSSDNSFLASLSVHAEDVVLTYMKNNEVATVKCGLGCMCLDVNDTSRYMLTGASDGIISVWDLKSKKVRKTYKDHKGPVTCAKFNHGTTSLASGSETGEIILYNVVTGQGCRPLTAPNIQAIKQVQYSHHKKSMLGSVSDDGSVNLWDCNTRQMIHSFTCHRAPATGLSFSPINDIFLMSVGLDKRIACHDLQTKKVVKIMSADSPLTSIDTLCDGVTVVVGSTRGKIYQYDLRMGSLPIRSLDAHKASVQCLRFQSDQKDVSHKGTETSKQAALNKQNKARQLPSSPKSNKEVVPVSVTSRPAQNISGEDVFSPLREGYQNQSNSVEEAGNHSGGSLSNSYGLAGPTNGSLTHRTSLNNKNSSHDSFSGGVFSPLNDNAGRGSSGVGLSPLAFPDYTSSDRNSSGLGVMDYNRINMQSGSPAPETMETEGGAPPLDPLSLPRHLPVSGHVTTSQSTPREVYDCSSAQTTAAPSGIPAQKQVAFMMDDPDPYAFLTASSSSTSDTSSPDVKRQRQTNQQQIGISASPSFPSIHLDDSPGSVSGGTNGTDLRNYRQPTTPDGVNAQSLPSGGQLFDSQGHSLDRREKNYTKRVLPPGDKSALTTQTQVGGAGMAGGGGNVDINQLGQIVRGVIQDEMGMVRQDMRRMVREEMDDMVDQIHRDIIHLQAEMLRQFQIHQSDMMTLLEHYSVNQDLVSEVDRLQGEVRRLQKHF